MPPTRDRSTATAAKIRLELARARHMLVRLDSAETLAVLQRVERQIALAPGDDALALYSEIAAMRSACFALQDDVPAALAAARSALRLHPHSPTAHVARSVCRYAYLHLGDIQRVEATTCGETSGYPDRLRAATAVFDCALDAMTELRKLHLNSARALADHALDMAQDITDVSPSIDLLPASIAAQVLFEQGRLEEAHALVAPRLPLVLQGGMIEGVLRCYSVLARIAASRGQPGHALALLTDAHSLAAKRRWPRLHAASLAQQVEIHLVMGSLSEATQCTRRLETLVAASAAGGKPALEMARYFAIAQARLALARPSGAVCVRQLQDMYRDCLSRHDFMGAVEVALLLVEARLRQQDDALDLLAAVMRRAVSVGLLQTLVDCNERVAELIATLGRGDISPWQTDTHCLRTYANLITARRRRARGLSQARESMKGNRPGIAGLLSTTPLSDRERVIVGLMSQGMTNKQIAMHLRIAPETVKSHAKHLYTKLSVKNRAEAVTVAARLGLAKLQETAVAASGPTRRIGSL
jgi:LuxR family maltose regulon positive regulatory protein